MCLVVSADVRGGGRLRDEPKERLRRRLESPGLVNFSFRLVDSVHHLPNGHVKFLGKMFEKIQINYCKYWFSLQHKHKHKHNGTGMLTAQVYILLCAD